MSWPPVTTSCTFSERGRTMVSGPGQKRAASLRALSGTSRAQRCRYFGLSRWTIDRVIGRPLLELEDAAHGRRVLRIGAEAVDRFGGKSDEFAVTQRGDGVFEFYKGCTNDIGP